MPPTFIRPIALAALALAGVCTSCPARAQSVDDMAWLAGCWRGHAGEAGTVVLIRPKILSPRWAWLLRLM